MDRSLSQEHKNRITQNVKDAFYKRNLMRIYLFNSIELLSFESAVKAADFLDTVPSSINNVLCGRAASTHGYKVHRIICNKFKIA